VEGKRMERARRVEGVSGDLRMEARVRWCGGVDGVLGAEDMMLLYGMVSAKDGWAAYGMRVGGLSRFGTGTVGGVIGLVRVMMRRRDDAASGRGRTGERLAGE